MLYLPVIDQDVLIFDIETIKHLRELGILGNFIGSLSILPQQNSFMGLPLKLTKYEVWWLVDHKLAKLVTNNKLAYTNNRKDKYFITRYTNDSDRGYDALLDKDGSSEIPDKENSKETSDKDYDNEITDKEIQRSDELDIQHRPSALEVQIDTEHQDLVKRFESVGCEKSYSIFRQLKNNGYFILPGLKFGGEFVVYPGDPIRYHSHYIVNATPSISVLNLVVSGRLASGVKKLFVITNPKEDEEQDGQEQDGQGEAESNNLIFAIEWAGFG